MVNQSKLHLLPCTIWAQITVTGETGKANFYFVSNLFSSVVRYGMGLF